MDNHVCTCTCSLNPLVRGQPANNLLHFRVRVDAEAFLLGHARQLHVLAVQLFFHDLFECLESENFGLGQGKRLVELVLQLCLGTLGPGAYGFGIVAVEGARGLRVVAGFLLAQTWLFYSLRGNIGAGEEDCDVQTRPILIIPRNQQRHTKRPAHDALLAFGTLSKSQRQIAYRLCAALDAQRLVVVEGMVLALDARVLDHAAGVGLQARHGAANVAVNLDNLLDGAGLEERARHALFYAQDDAFACCYLRLMSGLARGGDGEGRDVRLSLSSRA